VRLRLLGFSHLPRSAQVSWPRWGERELDRAINGTIARAGTFRISVRARDAVGAAAVRTFASPPTIDAVRVPSAEVERRTAAQFERYSNLHRHFFVSALPPLLLEVAERGHICDLGCGDGAVLWALDRAGLLEGGFAVDLSAERVNAATEAVPSVDGVVADATNTGLPDASANGVVASQLIEHLPDDGLLAPEIARLVGPGGWWYVGSVIRKPNAWWIYRVNGERRLDPTHVREYEGVEELVRVLRHPQLAITRTRLTPLRFPVIDLALRALVYARLLNGKFAARAYRRSGVLRFLRRLEIPVPGYELVEVAGTRT
jgi:SAM-dependent methyltransferase